MKQFNDVSIQALLGYDELLHNPSVVRSEVIALARFDEARVGTDKAKLAIMMEPGRLTFKAYAQEGTLSTASLVMAAYGEWNTYIRKVLDQTGQSIPRFDEILQSSFLKAATEPMDENMISLTEKMAEAIAEQSGITLSGDGSSPIATQKTLMKLAHALLAYDPQIVERYDRLAEPQGQKSDGAKKKAGFLQNIGLRLGLGS